MARVLERSGNLRHGTATVHVTGDAESTLWFDLGPPGYFKPPPGEMALEWIESYATAFSIEGRSFLGSRPSSSSLVLRLALGNATYQSADGQCRVTISTAKPDDVRGRFTCGGMRAKGETIRVRGAFGASR